MAIPTSRKLEYINIGDIVREIERKFPVDPYHSDWKSKKEINVRCPKCTDRKYHLGLNFAKNAFNCFRCPFKGKLSDFLKFNKIKFQTKGTTYIPETVSMTAPKIKIPIDFNRNEKVAKQAKIYMISRGFDLLFLKKNFNIWPITNESHFYFGYIIIKLNDYAFYARKFDDSDKTPHIIRKSDKTMKLSYAYEKNNSSTTLVVESMFNLMKAAQYGYDAVCIFGKGNWAAFTEYLKIGERDRSFCLCFDKDVIIKDIEVFIKRIQKSSQHFPELFYISPDDMPCNDIADMKDKETLIKMINKKRSIDELFINMMSIGD